MSTPPDDKSVPAIPLGYAVASGDSSLQRLRAALTIMIGVSLASVMGTWAFVIFGGTTPRLFGVRAFLFGGLLIALVSLATIVLSVLARRPIAMLSAVMNVLLCLGVWVLIALMGWTPQEARMPLVYIGLGYLAFAVPMSVFSFAKAGQDRRSNV